MHSHVHSDFIDYVTDRNIQMIQIPGGLSPVCQLCDSGIIKSFKSRVIEACQHWKTDEYRRMCDFRKIPVPGPKQLLEWLEKTWRDFPFEIVQIEFEKCGFTDNQDINIEIVLERERERITNFRLSAFF